jgi:signal transduction histidine kinase
VLDDEGNLALIIHRVEDITEFVKLKRAGAERDQFTAELQSRVESSESEVFLRDQEVADASRQLKEANAELARTYERTIELDRLKSQFFANVSHELRTPLALILGPAEQLASAETANPLVAQHASMIERNARALLRLVDDLLEAARLEAGRVELHYAEVDVAKIVRLTAANFETYALDRGIDYLVHTVEVGAHVDPERLHRVLLNLLSNAFKFTPRGGSVRVELRVGDGDGMLVVDVADSGPGVAPEHRDAVFGRFFQIEGGSHRRFGGTGIGLSIARDVVDLHGGTLTVEQAPEGGALFRVSLPMLAPAGVPVSERAGEGGAVTRGAPLHDPGGVAGAGEHDGPDLDDDDRPLVLVIEDNPDLRAFLVDALSNQYRVRTASNGREGLDRARRLSPDLIVSDLMLPELTGEEVLRELRRDVGCATTPFIVLTARADDALRVEVLRAGADDYVTKPFGVDELLARVKNTLARSKLREAERLIELFEDRDRIARDLHDTVIQRIFAAGLTVQGVRSRLGDERIGELLGGVVDELDGTIADLRTTILGLGSPPRRGRGLRRDIVDVVHNEARALGFAPTLEVDGPIDTVSRAIGDELLPTLREALSNVARHADASDVAVTIRVDDDVLLEVQDNGAGVDAAALAGYGLRNMETRALRHAGQCTVGPAEPHGTRLVWRVPNRGARR